MSEAGAEEMGVGRRKVSKKASLEGYEKAREMAQKGMSALDALDLDDGQGDVYEMMDDETYEKLVEKRRAEEEFVVDDGASPSPWNPTAIQNPTLFGFYLIR